MAWYVKLRRGSGENFRRNPTSGQEVGRLGPFAEKDGAVEQAKALVGSGLASDVKVTVEPAKAPAAASAAAKANRGRSRSAVPRRKRRNVVSSYKGQRYTASAGVYRVKDPVTGRMVSFGQAQGGKAAMQRWLDGRLLEAKRNPRTGKRWPVSSKVQSLLFAKGTHTVASAQTWAMRHGFKYGDVDEGGPRAKYIRLRQFSPSEVRKGMVRTIALTPGIKAVVAAPKAANRGKLPPLPPGALPASAIPTPRGQKPNPGQVATYKGKKYALKWGPGTTKYGYKAKLGFFDGSREFWVDGNAVSVSSGGGGSGASGGYGGRRSRGCSCDDPECECNRSGCRCGPQCNCRGGPIFDCG